MPVAEEDARKRLALIFVATMLAIIPIACSREAGVSNQNQNASPPPSRQKPDARGTIEVTSVPPGASVMLIETGEGGAGSPVPKGLTPTVIGDIAPGKYVVHLEKSGFRFFQKQVELKENEVVKVDARLRKD